MAPDDGHVRRLLTAGGILSVVAGIFQINNGVVLTAFFLTRGPHGTIHQLMPFWAFTPFYPGLWTDYWDFFYGFPYSDPIWFMIIGVCLLVLGILAVAGGMSFVTRKRFGLSLAGAIAALASGLLGILAIVLVAMGRRGFAVKAGPISEPLK
jgi:hypothetical protein